MPKTTLAFLLNLLCFAFLFLLFRMGIGSVLPLSHLPLLLGSAVLASFVAPKFLVKDGTLWVKLFWRKAPWRL